MFNDKIHLGNITLNTKLNTYHFWKSPQSLSYVDVPYESYSVYRVDQLTSVYRGLLFLIVTSSGLVFYRVKYEKSVWKSFLKTF